MSTDAEQQSLIIEGLRDLQKYIKDNEIKNHIVIDEEKIKEIKESNEQILNIFPAVIVNSPLFQKLKNMSVMDMLFNPDIEKNYDHKLFKIIILTVFLEMSKSEIKDKVKTTISEIDENHTIEDKHFDKIVSYIMLFVKILDC